MLHGFVPPDDAMSDTTTLVVNGARSLWKRKLNAVQVTLSKADAAGLVGCRNRAIDLVERLLVGLNAMRIDALCVRGCNALWAPIFQHGSLNPIKTLTPRFITKALEKSKKSK